MTGLKCRCTKGLSHVNSFRTINIHLLNHEFSDLNDLKVQSVALRSLEFHELISNTDFTDETDFSSFSNLQFRM